MSPANLEKLLIEQIPITQSMQIRILQADLENVELTCPLEPNHNHIGTAFGGSLSNIMILAAYCRLFIMIGGHGHVLLKNSSMEFLKPVNEDLRIVCLKPDEISSDGFLKTYKKKNRAKIMLTSEVRLKDGSVAARMKAEFVGYQEK